MESTFFYPLDRAYFEVKGKDARDFLNSIATNDIQKLTGTAGCYSLLLTPKGKIIADFYCYPCGNYFGIDCAVERKEILIEHLKRYIIVRDVQIQDRPEWGAVAIIGADANNFLEGKLEGFEHYLIPKTLWNLPVIELWTKKDQLPKLKTTLALPEITPEAAEILRIESATPKFGVDMDENTIPQEANLHSALCFDKGCYVGQETVTRLQHRGHVGKQLVQIKIDGKTVPPSGEKIFAPKGAEIGIITSGCFSQKWNASLALGTVRYAALSQSEILVGEKKLKGVILDGAQKPVDK